MALKFNVDAPVFVPRLTSSDDGFQPVKSKKQNKKPYHYRSRNGELWSPPKGWLPFYRCQACRTIMSRKEATKCPQRISSCGHITCAKCIVNSYLVELNPLCPVEGCGKCVNPTQTEAVAPLTILTEDPLTTPSTSPVTVSESLTTSVSADTELNDSEIDAIATKGYNPDLCHCRIDGCDWDCGTLWCGCIDVCRGRCGLREWESWGGYRWQKGKNKILKYKTE